MAPAPRSEYGRGPQHVRRYDCAAFRTRFDVPACAGAARRRQVPDFRSFLCLRSTLRHHRSHDARSKDSNQAERHYGRTQPAFDRKPVASIGVALTGMMTRTSMAWRKMTMIYEIRHLTARRRSPYPSARSLSPSALAPSGRCFSYSCDIGAPRPTRSRVTYDRQQVSWLAGYRLRPPSRDFSVSSGIYGRWLSAYSWGQPRICTRTCAHRIPLVSPCGHYQSQSWHPIGLKRSQRSN